MKSLLPPRSRILATISGLLLILACPPFDLFPLGWFALIPLFLALEKPRKKGFGEGFTAGLVFNTGLLYWLALNNGTYFLVAAVTMLAAVLILSISWGVAAWLFVWLLRAIGRPAWILAPFSWAAFEGWLSHLGELAFPWPLMALTQADYNPVLQVMEFTGVWGVSFWVVALNVALFSIWFGKRNDSRYGAFIILILLLLVPMTARMHAKKYDLVDLPAIKAAVVQGAIPPHEKWIRGFEFSWDAYDSLSRASAVSDPELVIWPETSLPVHLLHRSAAAAMITQLSTDIGAWIILGGSDYTRIGDVNKPINSAFLTQPGRGIVDKYGKRFLVPFGERVPFQKYFPVLGKLNFGQAEFLRGSRLTIFEVTTESAVARFPALICYESVAPWLSREAVLSGANLLVTISNDAWYGRSSQPSQIAALSRFRCIETRRAMARASNTGYSMLTDQFGRDFRKTGLFTRDWESCSLPLCEFETFYVRHGNVFLAIVSIIYGLGLMLALIMPAFRGGFRIKPDLNADRDGDRTIDKSE